MKILGRIIGIIVICLILALIVLRITGLDPNDQHRMPGLWLKGPVVTTPVADWSFTDSIPVIEVQTSTWYGIPHSVNTWCVSYMGQLYLTSVYPPGVTVPNRSWNKDVARDPHVRLKIAGNIYERTLTPVTDPAQRAAILAVKHNKYPQQTIRPGQLVNVFSVSSS